MIMLSNKLRIFLSHESSWCVLLASFLNNSQWLSKTSLLKWKFRAIRTMDFVSSCIHNNYALKLWSVSISDCSHANIKCFVYGTRPNDMKQLVLLSNACDELRIISVVTLYTGVATKDPKKYENDWIPHLPLFNAVSVASVETTWILW